MKYMVNGNYRGHVITRVTLMCTLVFLSGFWITNVLLYTQNLGFDPSAIVTYYRGSDEEFAMPRTYAEAAGIGGTRSAAAPAAARSRSAEPPWASTRFTTRFSPS